MASLNRLGQWGYTLLGNYCVLPFPQLVSQACEFLTTFCDCTYSLCTLVFNFSISEGFGSSVQDSL